MSDRWLQGQLDLLLGESDLPQEVRFVLEGIAGRFSSGRATEDDFRLLTGAVATWAEFEQRQRCPMRAKDPGAIPLEVVARMIGRNDFISMLRAAFPVPYDSTKAIYAIFVRCMDGRMSNPAMCALGDLRHYIDELVNAGAVLHDMTIEGIVGAIEIHHPPILLLGPHTTCGAKEIGARPPCSEQAKLEKTLDAMHHFEEQLTKLLMIEEVATEMTAGRLIVVAVNIDTATMRFLTPHVVRLKNGRPYFKQLFVRSGKPVLARGSHTIPEFLLVRKFVEAGE